VSTGGARGARRAGRLLVLAVVLAGCGYSWRGSLPDDIRTVAVPVFANLTGEPAIEGILTRAVVAALASNGRLRVVGLHEADAVLEGEVVDYRLDSIAFDPAAQVREFRVLVTLNLRFRDVRRNTLLFAQNGLRERADFRVLGNVAETIAREETAVRAVAIDIARTIVSLAVERF
jgi:hypothetical protein